MFRHDNLHWTKKKSFFLNGGDLRFSGIDDYLTNIIDNKKSINESGEGSVDSHGAFDVTESPVKDFTFEQHDNDTLFKVSETTEMVDLNQIVAHSSNKFVKNLASCYRDMVCFMKSYIYAAMIVTKRTYRSTRNGLGSVISKHSKIFPLVDSLDSIIKVIINYNLFSYQFSMIIYIVCKI
jgi:hypothetical protein